MAEEGFVVRIRGLPWSVSVDEVQRFFAGEHPHVVSFERQNGYSPHPPRLNHASLTQVAKL